MNRRYCLILSVLLLICTISACAESTNVNFDAALTNSTDHSASEWFFSKDTRALLTILLLVDCQSALSNNSTIDLGAVLASTSYVANSNTHILVAGNDGSNIITIMYTPALKYAEYSIFDSSDLNDLEIQGILTNILSSFGEYFVNDAASIQKCMNTLDELINQ